MNAAEKDNKAATPPGVPFGTHPRRAAWPLVTLIVLYALGFAALVWLTFRYPIR